MCSAENCRGATYGGVYNVVGLVLLCTDIPKPSLLAIAELLVVWRYVLQELSFKMYSGLKVSKPSCFSCCLRYNPIPDENGMDVQVEIIMDSYVASQGHTRHLQYRHCLRLPPQVQS